jgi:aminoglycoside phosphotransferase (APT) family kinase protein
VRLVPDEDTARVIARSVLGDEIDDLDRFPMGLTHWVYDVALKSGRNVVIRVASPEHRADLVGAVYWQEWLRPLGVPLAEVLFADVDAEFPYLILQRLPGTDLGNVYAELTIAQRTALAQSVAGLQELAGRLPEAKGFGYALSYESNVEREWTDVLGASLRGGRSWIERAGAVNPGWADKVEVTLARMIDTFDDVRPRAFLHDVTTKNVIVHRGALSGIVDVDSMAFGDPLWTLALTRMSLLALRQPLDYVDAQAEALARPTTMSAERLDLYTALHGLSFLGELGQAFNRSAPPVIDLDHQQHLEETMSSLLR